MFSNPPNNKYNDINDNLNLINSKSKHKISEVLISSDEIYSDINSIDSDLTFSTNLSYSDKTLEYNEIYSYNFNIDNFTDVHLPKDIISEILDNNNEKNYNNESDFNQNNLNKSKLSATAKIFVPSEVKNQYSSTNFFKTKQKIKNNEK
jgi:hypothetical protein